jgi:hypothetical protein
MTMLPSLVGDGTIGATGPRRDVDVESCWRHNAAESCWRHCCRVMLVMALQLKVVLAVVRLCSPRDQSFEVHHEEVGYLC